MREVFRARSGGEAEPEGAGGGQIDENVDKNNEGAKMTGSVFARLSRP